MATAVAANGFQPATISAAATAPPSGKLPSTVRSGKLMMRNERKTPSATSPKIRPISMRAEGCDERHGRVLARRAPSPASGRGEARCSRSYLTTTLADLTSSSLSVTPCFCAAAGLTCSSKVLLVCEAILPGALALQDAHHDLAGLAAEVVVVEAERGDGAALDGVGVGGDDRQLGLLRDLDDALERRHHVVVGRRVDHVGLADQALRGARHVDRARGGGFDQREAGRPARPSSAPRRSPPSWLRRGCRSRRRAWRSGTTFLISSRCLSSGDRSDTPVTLVPEASQVLTSLAATGSVTAL